MCEEFPESIIPVLIFFGSWKKFPALVPASRWLFIVFEIVSMRKLSCDVFENFSSEAGTEKLCVHCRLSSDSLQLSIYIGKKWEA